MSERMVYNLQHAKFYQTPQGELLFAVVSKISEREDVVTLIGPRTSIEVTDELAERVKRLWDSDAHHQILKIAEDRGWYEAHIKDPNYLPGDPEIRGNAWRNSRDLA